MINPSWFDSKPINIVDGNSLSEALEKVYMLDDYYLKNSYWFIDINNQFRIFKYNEKSYISKKISHKLANNELEKSKKAYSLLNDKLIANKKINIIIPKKIVLNAKKQNCYLVSEYIHQDMNNDLYSDSKISLTLNECISILKLLITNGIEYRGFLPRNTISKNGIIYLFDWEDSIYSPSKYSNIFNQLWKTSFLLNWGYIYDFSKLEIKLNSLIDPKKKVNNPELLDYEIMFKKLTNHNGSTNDLRNKIDIIVFGSELPLTKKGNYYFLHPNDAACLISDIFPIEIDVLYDLLTCSYRKNNENKFYYHILLITHIITLHLKSGNDNKQKYKDSIKFYLLITILMLTNNNYTIMSYKNILVASRLDVLIIKILEESQDYSLAKLFLTYKESDLPEIVFNILKSKLTTEFSNIEFNDSIILEISRIIIKYNPNKLSLYKL